jgi:glycosyltransferase involved in cell wall biosynthesis
MLPHAQTAELFNALDVGVVYLRDSPYGRYSFPQKAYEMAACGIPLAVTRVGAMETLFAERQQVLYEPDDAGSLAACLANQLSRPEIAALHIPDWAALAALMEAAYRAAVGSTGD